MKSETIEFTHDIPIKTVNENVTAEMVKIYQLI